MTNSFYDYLTNFDVSLNDIGSHSGESIFNIKRDIKVN